MKYKLKDITIKVVDISDLARKLYGDKAEEIAGWPMPEHDYRFEIHAKHADGKTTISCPTNFFCSAEDILKMLNR